MEKPQKKQAGLSKTYHKIKEWIKFFIRDDSGEWIWLFRWGILIAFFLLAGVSAWFTLKCIAPFLICQFPILLGENKIFAGALALATFVFVNGIGVWIIRTHDTKKQFRDSFQQQKASQTQQYETLFSNAIKLLFDTKDIARGVGLQELLQLRDPQNQERIDRITSSGLNLEQAKLQKADLRKADLLGANLQKAKLLDADLRGANLQGANLQEAELQFTTLQKAVFFGANLQKTQLEGANLQETDLQKADLQKADLQEANFLEADLYKANLREANLQRAKLQRADLQEADLQEADLRGAYLQGAEFFEANLQGAKLQNAELREAYLQEANLKNIEWDNDTSFKNVEIDQKALDTITNEELKDKIKREAKFIIN